MAICKICKKTFKQLTSTHVKKHGMESLDHYHTFTKDFKIPQELIEENEKLEADMKEIRSQKASKGWDGNKERKEKKEKLEATKDFKHNSSLANVLQTVLNKE